MLSLRELEILARTVDAGSLSAAARALDITPAAASAAVKRLEQELGVELLVRSTRSLRLTAAGEQLLEHGRPALEALQQAVARLTSGEQALTGQVKLAAPSDLGRHALLEWLDAFCERYPGVDVRLHLSDRLANIYSDPIDAALRYGAPADSTLVALPLLPRNRRLLVASREYLERRGAPATPRDLAAHDCLCFMQGDEVADRWRFTPRGKPPESLTVKVTSRFVANDAEVVRRWAVQGKGIAYKSALDVAQDVAQRRLTVLCPRWGTEALPLMFVVPGRRHLSPLLRALHAFIGACVAQFPIDAIAHTGRGRRPRRSLG